MAITSVSDAFNEGTVNDKTLHIDYWKERPSAVGAQGYWGSQWNLSGTPGPMATPAAGAASNGGTRRRFVGSSTTNTVTVTSNVATATTDAAHGLGIGDLITTTGLSVNTSNTPVISVPSTTQITYALVTGNGDLADMVGTIECVNQHGCIWIDDVGGDTLYLTQFESQSYSNSLAFYLFDRLWDCSGVVTSSTGAKNCNSLALPRYTTGGGVECWMECTTAVTGTTPAVTMNYTNSAGTSGRSGPSFTFPASLPLRGMVRLPLQAGDTGIQTLQNITVDTASSAGTFNVLLVKPIDFVNAPANMWAYRETLYRDEGPPTLEARPCLQIAHKAGGTSGMTWVHARLGFMWG